MYWGNFITDLFRKRMNDCLTEFAIRKYSMLFVHTLKSILRFDLAKCFLI